MPIYAQALQIVKTKHKAVRLKSWQTMAQPLISMLSLTGLIKHMQITMGWKTAFKERNHWEYSMMRQINITINKFNHFKNIKAKAMISHAQNHCFHKWSQQQINLINSLDQCTTWSTIHLYNCKDNWAW